MNISQTEILKQPDFQKQSAKRNRRLCVLIAHDSPVVAAGLASTLQRHSYVVVRRHSTRSSESMCLDNVHVVLGDVANVLAMQVHKQPTAIASAAPKVVLVVTREADAPDGIPADARIPVDCAEDELIAAVRRLGSNHASAPRGGLAPAALRRVREHVDARLAEPIAIGDLAEIAGLSSCHFARAFKQSVGLPPHRYVMERRIETAAHLIQATGMKLADIALDVGLCDQSHLTRLFASRKGCTPLAFRRAL